MGVAVGARTRIRGEAGGATVTATAREIETGVGEEAGTETRTTGITEISHARTGSADMETAERKVAAERPNETETSRDVFAQASLHLQLGNTLPLELCPSSITAWMALGEFD